MAIGTDAAIGFFGTQDTLGTSSAAVADGDFSIASDLSTWTNDDDAISANVIGFFDYAVAPDANSFINLYCRPLNIQSTNDSTIPNATFQHVFVKSFPVSNTTDAQYIPTEISLPNAKASQEYEFYIENKTGQSIPANWDIHITPKAVGPHA